MSLFFSYFGNGAISGSAPFFFVKVFLNLLKPLYVIGYMQYNSQNLFNAVQRFLSSYGIRTEALSPWMGEVNHKDDHTFLDVHLPLQSMGPMGMNMEFVRCVVTATAKEAVVNEEQIDDTRTNYFYMEVSFTYRHLEGGGNTISHQLLIISDGKFVGWDDVDYAVVPRHLDKAVRSRVENIQKLKMATE